MNLKETEVLPPFITLLFKPYVTFNTPLCLALAGTPVLCDHALAGTPVLCIGLVRVAHSTFAIHRLVQFDVSEIKN
jgi:hypothetical protein